MSDRVLRNKKAQRPVTSARDPHSLQNVVKKLEKFAPIYLAESWDNVGVLVEPPSEVQIKRVLLTNDLTERVLEEAIERDTQLIISYHPLIFPALKSIKYLNWKDRIIGTLLERRIALYSPHTAWDAVDGGVNDWLACAFGEDIEIQPLKRFDSGYCKVVNAWFAQSHLADKAIADIHSAEHLSCSINTVQERSGKVWVQIQIDNEYQCLPFLRLAYDVNISSPKKLPTGVTGVGRKVVLKDPISLQTAVSLIKHHLKLPDVAVATAHGISSETKISTIAICAGSGGSVLKGVGADLYFTGEMSHHEVLDAVQLGTHVILTRHSNSERGFLEIVANSHLKNLMPQIEFIVSSNDKDPLVTM